MRRFIFLLLSIACVSFVKAQSIMFPSAKPVITKKIDVNEAFPFSFSPFKDAELEFWRLSEKTPQNEIDRASIHVIQTGKFTEDINNKAIGYNADGNRRLSLDSLCIVHDVTVSDNYTQVVTESTKYYWIGASEQWISNITPATSDGNANLEQIIKKHSGILGKDSDRLEISEDLFNWIKGNFPSTNIKEERQVKTVGDLLDSLF